MDITPKEKIKQMIDQSGLKRNTVYGPRLRPFDEDFMREETGRIKQAVTGLYKRTSEDLAESRSSAYEYLIP